MIAEHLSTTSLVTSHVTSPQDKWHDSCRSLRTWTIATYHWL